MGKLSLAAALLVCTCVCASAAVAQNTSAPTASSGITLKAPTGLVSIHGNSAAHALMSSYVPGSAMVLDDAFVTPGDFEKMAGNVLPDGHHYVMVLQPVGASQPVSAQIFAFVQQRARQQIMNQQQVANTNAMMKSGKVGIPGTSQLNIQGYQGETIVLDEPDRLSKFFQASMGLEGSSKHIVMDGVMTLIRIHSHVFVIDAYAREESPADKAWLTHDMVAWIKTLPAGD